MIRNTEARIVSSNTERAQNKTKSSQYPFVGNSFTQRNDVHHQIPPAIIANASRWHLFNKAASILFKLFTSCALCGFLSLANTASADIVLNLTAIESGNYHEDGYRQDDNNNYITGASGPDVGHNSFFIFDLSSVTSPILSAEIRLFNPIVGGMGTSGPERELQLFDVSTPINEVGAGYDTGSLQGQAIYADLGSGTLLGSTNGPYANGSLVTVSLNANGLNYLNSSLGGLVAIGTHYAYDALATNNYVFAWSGSGPKQLSITAVPEPTCLTMLSLASILCIKRRWNRRKQERTIALDPQSSQLSSVVN